MSTNNVPVRQSKSIRCDAPPEQLVALQPIPVERLLTTRQVAAMVNAKIEDCEKVEAAPHRATLSQAG